MKPTRQKIIPFLTLLAILIHLAEAQISFIVSSAVATPNTARSANSQYNIFLNAMNPSATNLDISVSFTSAFSVSSVSGCQVLMNGNTLASAVCSASSNVVTFTSLGISSVINNLTLIFNTSTAIYTGQFVATLSYYQPGNTANTYSSNSALINIINAQMACSLTSTSLIVGVTSNYSLTYTPSASISAGSLLQITFPAWSAYVLTNFPSGTASTVCSGQCTIRNPNTGQGLLNQMLTYSTLYSADTSSSKTITMLNARNPASTKSISVTATLLYYLSSTSQPSYMTCTANFQATTPGTFSSLSFTPSSSAISTSSTISLFLSLPDPISSISYLSILYASDLQLSYSYATSNQQTTQVIVPSGQANALLIGNLTNSTSQVTSLFMASFTITNAPYAGLSNSITFLTQNLVSGTYYSIDSKTITLTTVVSTITTATVSLSNSSIGIVSNLTVTFKLVNSLISGSQVIITVPTQITLSNSSTCSSTVSSSCSLYNSTSILVNINAISVAANTNLSVTINSVANPPTTTPTSSFSISTYYYNTSTPVDSLTTGLTVTATPVTLFSTTVTSSSLKVSDFSNYTITLQNRNTLPSGSTFTITFPTDFPNSASATLASFKIGNSLVASCTMQTASTMKYNFINCINSPISAQTTLTVVINNIINPPSTQPTSSFQLQTSYNNNVMQYIYSGLTITMTIPASLSFSSIALENDTANSLTNYLFSLTFSQTYYSGDSILIIIPSTITLNVGFACTTSTSGITVSCFQQSTDTLKITMTGTIGASIIVKVTNLKNNWYAGDNTFTLKTTTNDTSHTYYKEQGTAVAKITPATLTTSCITTNALVLLSSSSLSLAITSPFSLSPPNPSLLTITVTLPNDFTPTSSCTTSITGVVCSLSGNTYTLTSLTTFTSSINVTVTANAGYFTTSGVFTSTIKYNNNNVAQDTSLTVAPFCSSPCKGCTNSNTQCTSCLPTPYTSNNYLFSTNYTCVTECPTSYYVPAATSTCQQCNTSACLNCSGTASTCTACSTPYFLYNSTCRQVCPDKYYGSGTLCLSCINQCYNCSNISYCLTCVSGYSLNPNHTCLSSCPSGYISISQVCTACTSPCATCSGSLTFCTGCGTGYILYNNTCVLACPVGKYKDENGNCVNCISPCKYCTTATTCTSCITNYYLYNSSQCVAGCPAGTYAVVTDCQLCSNSCQTCNNIPTNCTSCSSGLYLYVNTCYNQCPTSTYPYLNTCTTCVSPCATCLNGAFSCSTCQSGYLLLNISCVLSCPSTGYLQISGSCIACPSNCVSCSSSISCNACASGYYEYHGSCVSSCPSTSPIIVNQACTSCSSQCSTCYESPEKCLTCTLYYYKYSYTCVKSCPLPYYSNQIDYTCESGLSSKIVFFPIFITYLVVIVLLIIIKIFSNNTSFPTSLTAFSGWLQFAIWCYLLSLIFASYLEPGITYELPRALLFIAILSSLLCNFLHFKINGTRIQQDDYIIKWQAVNVNHTYLVAIRYIALFTHHKFFRIVYSKLFNSLHFSMVAFKKVNLFSVSTCFSVTCLLTSQIPVLVAAFYLAYNKILKDQVFYTAVEALAVTVLSSLFALIDIYKPDNYFEDTEFMQTKRYLDKVNNDSINKLEDQYRNKDQGSVDNEKQMGLTGGKFVFKKGGDLASMNELLFQEQSAATDAHDPFKKTKLQVEDIQMEDNEGNNEYSQRSVKSRASKSGKSPRSPVFAQNVKGSEAKINIFQPIQEEQAEYYEVLKYDEQDFKTAAKIQQQRLDGNASEQENELEQERKDQFGLPEAYKEQIDDNLSLMEYRERREEWNKIIDHRKNLAHQIFNTIDTRELYRINEDEEIMYQSPPKQKVFNRLPERLRKLQEAREEFEAQLRRAKHKNNMNKMTGGEEEEQIFEEREPSRKRRRRKPIKNNKKLQQIYLQRLAEKVQDPKRKTMYTSKTFKYQF